MPRGRWLRWALLCCAWSRSALARVVTISNVVPRVDRQTSLPLELGDGSLIQVDGTYYLYGVRYQCAPSPHCDADGNCNRTDITIWRNMTFGVASSKDLTN
jgi:hypothetical protein